MIKLVIAGPGTGKTTFITESIKKLLERKVKPENILALTFTEKSSEEMLGRLDEAMPLGYEPPWISTFHGFCDRILRQEGLEIGLDPAYKIITEPEAWLLLRQNLFDLPLDYYRPLGNPTKFLTSFLTFVSRAKDEEVSPEEYMRWILRLRSGSSTKEEKEEARRQLELAKTYQKYQELLLKNSYLDFGDLIIWAIKLFIKRPNLLANYQQQFRHIFVDEFQDTNIAQFSLIKLLVPSRLTVGWPGPAGPSNLTVVGDDDQAIYKWRGASVSNILQFKKEYPKSKVEVLKTTYRLTDKLAQSTYKLIQNNNPDRLEKKLKISKKLKTLKSGPEPQLLYARSQEEEADLVLRKIVDFINTEGKEYRDFAILARANAHLAPFIAALKRHALPYQVVGNRGLFEQEEVSALLAVLRVVRDPQDSISWYKVLNIPAFKISSPKVLELLNESKRTNVSLVEILKAKKIRALGLIDELAEKSFKVAPSHLLFDFVQKSGYIQNFVEMPTLENQLRIENISLFFQKIHQFEAEAKEPNVPELVEYLDMLIEAGESPAQAVIEDVDTINVMTVHAAKGLEFPVVFLVSLTSDRFPTRQRSEAIALPESFIKEVRSSGDEHLQEERRLFYVGATRASERLFLTFAQSYGGMREKKPSPFIHELEVEVPEIEKRTPSAVLEPVEGPPASGWEIPWKLPPKLSYSQLEDYKTCPWKYRYKYVLKIPAPPTPPMSFGISLHETLREFEIRRMRGENITLADLLAIFAQHFLSGGYRDPKEKEAYRRRGKKMLRDFYNKYGKKLLPAFMVEKDFEIKIGGKILAGRIDRIGKDKKGNYEIIDFKTGEASQENMEKLKKRAQSDDQLLLYTIAAKEALGIEPKAVSLFYLDNGEKVEVKLSGEEIKKRKSEIETRIKSIASGDFHATPGPQCVPCPFNKICEFSQADRYR